MKNNLNYQTSEYDCGPTTLINAMRYLFEREELSPEILKAISMYTLDTYNEEGEVGKHGTSAMAMRFLSSWFNQFGEKKRFPIYTEFLDGKDATLTQNSRITECLQQKGIVVLRVWLDGDGHYILLTDIQKSKISVFDPYLFPQMAEDAWIEIVKDQPQKMNRIISLDRINESSNKNYAMGEFELRHAMLLYNKKLRLTSKETIEYMI
jgi:hypothetical protein